MRRWRPLLHRDAWEDRYGEFPPVTGLEMARAYGRHPRGVNPDGRMTVLAYRRRLVTR